MRLTSPRTALVATCAIAFATSASPALSANTYAWPLTLYLPLSVSVTSAAASAMDGNGNLNVACTYTPAAGTSAGKALNAFVNQPPKVPVVFSSPPAGSAVRGYSYNGNMKLTIFAVDGLKAPASGDTVTCKMAYGVAGANANGINFTNSGPSTYTLP